MSIPTDRDNLDIWRSWARPPETALKKIGGGRLAGMSDIDPMWRYQELTKRYGPCGVGWHFSIEQLWSEASGDEILCFAKIHLIIKDDIGEWSEPIPGMGGSKLLARESKGPYANDEGYKMAVTDALGTACKMLGIAADVYMGRMDGSKYQASKEANEVPPAAQPRGKSFDAAAEGARILGNVGKQAGLVLQGVLKDAGLSMTGDDATRAQLGALLHKVFGIGSTPVPGKAPSTKELTESWKVVISLPPVAIGQATETLRSYLKTMSAKP